ncbi:hypothetical protein [Paraburkholderia sp. RL17-337-BIB-A]|uniref:hypothetical protein n=1 Tax=Paraburkholderia sp. RL17-337-BIB-A TaxID=3031636 RepID=UPI0038B8AEA9
MSRFLCLSFFAAAEKVSAASHRGNTNRPITIQGKAKTMRKQIISTAQATTSRKHQQAKPEKTKKNKNTKNIHKRTSAQQKNLIRAIAPNNYSPQQQYTAQQH